MTPSGPLILCVEDDPGLRQLLRTVLPAHGYRILEAETGAEALRLANQHVPDLMLLDLGLPDMDGLAVLAQLRGWSALPVVILSARDQEAQKVAALDAGADDYLTKPFGLAELLARLRVALRHGSRFELTSAMPCVEIGPLRIDAERRQVSFEGADIALSPIEFRLLTLLAEANGRVVTHRQLLRAIWGPHSERHRDYLRVYMAHLRKKLKSPAGGAPLIATETGVGYRLQLPEDAG